MKKLIPVLVAVALVFTLVLCACQPTTFTVTFSYNYENAPDNGVYKTVTVNSGENVTKPADPTREGYEFTGWVTTANGTTEYVFGNAIEGDLTVYATWKAKETPAPQTLTVKFLYNYDGAPTDGVYKTESVNKNEKVTEPADPTREGYEFKGWMTTANGNTAFDFDTAITVATTIYASWEEEEPTPPEPTKYTVTFNYNYDGAPNDGVYKTENVSENEKVTKPADPTREGYEFKGWITTADGNTAYDFNTAITEAITIYATWEEEEEPTPPEPTKYTVTFNYNYDGAPNDGVYKTENVTENEKVTKPADPARTGYEFKGWITTADGNTAFDFDTAITEATTIYATWEEEEEPTPTTYVVTFNYNYDGAPTEGIYKTETITEGQKVTKPADPTRTGYDFMGWMTTADGDTTFDFDTAITEATTVYAKWEIKEYTVTLYYNYDGAPDEGKYYIATVTHNGTIEMPHAPARTGYEFNGWADAATGGSAANTSAAITSDTDFYATWTAFDSATIQKVTTSQDLVVNKVANLSEDFIMGMDASSVYSLESAGVKFYDYDGTETDVFKVLAESGINTVRIRVWNDPFDEDGNGYGGGNNDIYAALEMGKRITTYGMGVMIDFHYSDFWADPGKQQVPKAWAGYTVDQKAAAIEAYTKESLQLLKNAGVNVTIVQVGNETTNSICGESNWANRAKLFNAGSKAVRDVYPQALVAIHFTNPERAGNYANFAQQLNSNNVDYDVFASSWYPFWHGTLDNLTTVLSNVATTYNKKVMVAETSYAYTLEDMDFHDNTVRQGANSNSASYGYEFSVQGQADLVRDTINAIANTTNGIGVCYWEGTWISVVNTGATTKAECLELWEKYGCGWASSYASDYDPNDAGKWYGGSAVDNQALFATNGSPLESLKVFSLVYIGCNEPVIKDLFISGAMNGWTPDMLVTVDYKTHTATFTYEFTSEMLGSSNGFGFTVCPADAADQSTDNQLCWIGGASNCKIGDELITVDFSGVCASIVTTASNLYATEAGVYKFVITFSDDDSTPLTVSATKLTYSINFNGGTSSWKDQAIEGATVDMVNHKAEFQMTFTKDSGNFGFTINDPATGDQIAWIGGTGNVKVNGVTIKTMQIIDENNVMEVSAGTHKRDFHLLYMGTYTFTIVFEADNVTPKTLTVVPGDDVELPTEPEVDVYNVYINGALTGSSWTTVKGGDIDNETHTATFNFTFDNAGSAFGFKVFKNDNTATQLCWIGQDGNIWMSSQITGVTFTDNTEKFATSGSGNITVSDAGTYKFTIVFGEDNTTPISITIDNVEASE